MNNLLAVAFCDYGGKAYTISNLEKHFRLCGGSPTAKWIMYFCLAMALISALVYGLLIVGIFKVGDMVSSEGVPAYFYIVPAGYAVGGFLILLKKRWLWIIGTVLNAIPIIVFYAAYAGKPDVMLSAAGLTSKTAQVLLEIGLIYMIVVARRS